MKLPIAATCVIFGAAGDLAYRKLLPALYALYVDRRLPEQCRILGVDRAGLDDKTFAQHAKQGVEKFSKQPEVDRQPWERFASDTLAYIKCDLTDRSSYLILRDAIEAQDRSWDRSSERIFYLATAPTLVQTIALSLKEAGLVSDPSRSRVVIEKPFGRDLSSALELNRTLAACFEESQIYRIDHYLAKETVQNILALRFANSLFEPLWNRNYIDSVQISVAEQVGVEHRAKYYDSAGALRDMIENHLLELLSLIAMESPTSFDADEIRSKKIDVLRAVRPVTLAAANAVRGQYTAGEIGGQRVCGYTQEPGVAQSSSTETFAALRLFVDNWRWQDVPFYLRTGKRLASHSAWISIQFRAVPHRSFPTSVVDGWAANSLTLHIQPKQDICLKFQVKRPGFNFLLAPADMCFSYQESFQCPTVDAYQTLLEDIFSADQTLFVRAEREEIAWQLVTPILEAWQDTAAAGVASYSAGTWGPAAAEQLVRNDGRTWLGC